jgi:hypothetical protein
MNRKRNGEVKIFKGFKNIFFTQIKSLKSKDKYQCKFHLLVPGNKERVPVCISADTLDGCKIVIEGIIKVPIQQKHIIEDENYTLSP